MSSRSFLAFRNWCAEYGAASTLAGSFFDEAPVTNLLTPRLGQLAILQNLSVADDFGFRVDWSAGDSPESQGRPVHMVAILHHNIIRIFPSAGMTYFSLLLRDAAGEQLELFAEGVGDLSPADSFQSHLITLIPEVDPKTSSFNRDKVVSVTIGWSQFGVQTGRKDPVTGIVTPAPFQAGGLWAGPIWRPKRGIRLATPEFGVTEAQRGVRSIGGQFYPQPQPRVRRVSAELASVDEGEAFNELQQMAAWCGVSRPVILVPDSTDPHLVYTQGVYGYFDEPLSWSNWEAGGEDGREYRSTFGITEAL